MLATDLADLPADLLERAISDWSVRSPYMPKAFDLVQLAKSYLPKPEVVKEGPTDWEMLARQRNDRLASDPDGRRDIRWVASSNGVYLEFDPTYVAPMDRFIARLANGQARQHEVDDAPKYWRNVAEERGYLRRQDDGSHVIREWKGPLA